MVGLVHAVADSLHQIGGHLARLEGKDHVGRHGEVCELGIRDTVLYELFIENSSLDSDGKPVEILDLLELACIDGCSERHCTEEQDKKENKCFLHNHSSTHLKLMSI